MGFVLFLVCLCVRILPAYIFMYHMLTVPMETRKRCGIPWTQDWLATTHVGARDLMQVLWRRASVLNPEPSLPPR